MVIDDATRAGLVKVENRMDDLEAGDPEPLLRLLGDCSSQWHGDWGAGTKAAVLAVLGSCLPRDFGSSTRSGVGFMNNGPGWFMFRAGEWVHTVAKLDDDRYGLAVHQDGAVLQDMSKGLDLVASS
jgi:hypothetical protein